MYRASERLDFEEAAQYRDLIQVWKKIGERQKITDQHKEDKDIVAAAIDGEDAVTQVFFVRDGKLIGRDHFYMKTAPGDDRRGVLSSFLKQFYAGNSFYSQGDHASGRSGRYGADLSVAGKRKRDKK